MCLNDYLISILLLICFFMYCLFSLPDEKLVNNKSGIH